MIEAGVASQAAPCAQKHGRLPSRASVHRGMALKANLLVAHSLIVGVALSLELGFTLRLLLCYLLLHEP